MATAEPISPVSTTDVNLHETAEPSHNDAQFMRDLETASPWKPNDEPGDCPERAVNSNLVEAADVDTNTATADDKCIDITDLPKKLHKEKQLMDRLGVAIDKAIAAGTMDLNNSTRAKNGLNEKKFINARFGDSAPYVIPWAACYSWHVVEVLLMEWFKESEEVLHDISNGDITVDCLESGLIHPRTWEQVVEHNAGIQFWPHSSYPNLSSPEEPGYEQEANYESRVQYVINYFQNNGRGVLDFVGHSTHKKPVEFEITDDYERLPALEEIKRVTTSHYQNVPKREEGGEGKKTKLGPNDRVTETYLRINSQFLLNVLKSVVEYTIGGLDGVKFGLGPGLFCYPYKELYYHMPDMLKYKTDPEGLRKKHSTAFNQKCDDHIDLLLGYLTSQPQIPVKECMARWESKSSVVTFATFWLLIRPGTDVYVRENDESMNAYIVDSVQGGVSEEDGKKTNKDYQIGVWNLAYDGTQISPNLRTINISVFDNEREITSLPVFPVRFIDGVDGGKLKEKLVNRGKKYYEYSKHPSFLEYSGKGLKEGGKIYQRTRVVIEHATAPWFSGGLEIDHHVPDRATEQIRQSIRVPRCECKDCRDEIDLQEIYAKEKFGDYHAIIPGAEPELPWHQCMLMSSHMFAFILKDRTYDLLEVDRLEEPRMAETAIDSLVMDNANKELIKAIAQTYTDSDQSQRFSADFIHGKGEGQIILLHGPPGTGKTLTAESVAEYTKRPLLSITAADLGHEPEALEKSLLRYFKRASDWDAIVLLDEADVYLEQRTTHDLKRNSVVSVFLRALDYFQGILFLTTNRVGHFDEAFMSRIHLSLGYDKLTDNGRGRIWDNLFKKLGDDHKRGGPQINYEYHAKSYVKSSDVQSLEWNGREIRNAFQTAVALAFFDSKHDRKGDIPEVTENHLKQVVSMSSAFREYIMAAHSGMDNSTWAFKHGNREDKFPSTPAKQET